MRPTPFTSLARFPFSCATLVFVCLVFVVLSPLPARASERLNRGLIAIPTEDGVYLGWRLLQSDPAGLVFNLYRATGDADTVKVNDRPIIEGNNFLDTAAPRDQRYEVFQLSTSLPTMPRCATRLSPEGIVLLKLAA